MAGGLSMNLYHLADVCRQVALFWPWFFPAVFVVLGGVFGSFLTCALWRVPRGESLRHPPSHCPACDAQLAAADLVPVLSWLVLRGRCRHCGAKVSAYYIIVELLCVGVGLGAWCVSAPNAGQALVAFAGGVAGLFVVLLSARRDRLALKTLLFAFAMLWLWVVLHRGDSPF